MKVIFLDVDGVLNHQACPGWQTGEMHVLDEACVARVWTICRRTGCVIVVSSTWRSSPSAMQLLRQKFGTLIVGVTPIRDIYGRHKEIQAWLDSHPGGRSYVRRICVIDDDLDAEVPGQPFVRTSVEAGELTDELTEQVVAALTDATVGQA